MTAERATILVVEDDRPLQDALVTTLSLAGFKVLAAGDGGVHAPADGDDVKGA